jgi:putative transposase
LKTATTATSHPVFQASKSPLRKSPNLQIADPLCLYNKVAGWALDRALAMRLTVGALEQAIERRQPNPGLVHHSDRGLQYARGEYIAILEKYHMIPSMSRPANVRFYL